MDEKKRCLILFRNDLRINDNPTIRYACKRKFEIIPIFLLDESIGDASKIWLHKSLTALDKELDGKLCVYKGEAYDVISNLIKSFQIHEIILNKMFDSKSINQEKQLTKISEKFKTKLSIFNSSLLLEPENTVKPDGSPYKVFTAFYKKNYINLVHDAIEFKPKKISAWKPDDATSISDFDHQLLPTSNWHSKLISGWKPGELGAKEKLDTFIANGLNGYAEKRNRPDLNNVSRLSPHIHHGEISPSQIITAIGKLDNIDKEKFYTEIVWREFSYNLLFYNQKIHTDNIQKKFNDFKWLNDEKSLTAWQKGKTGYPIVDAGMRELWQTGYMHNRLRMIVGSFLVKNLLIHWHHGRDWFWNTLFDADLANNSASWQWVAGTGADAAPYFRIFNPITQSQKFDPDGVYIRKYIPELKKLPNKYIHDPFNCPPLIMKASGIKYGEDYPLPIVNLKTSRTRALNAFHILPKNK